MFSGIGNALAVTALISFINLVYARPWEQDERALLLPGILGGMIGYAIGVQIRESKRWYWLALVVGSILGLSFSLLYNEVLLRMPTKPREYEVLLYLCFFLMNAAAFSVFGVIGWTMSAKNSKSSGAE
jgi:hypothetical protein